MICGHDWPDPSNISYYVRLKKDGAANQRLRQIGGPWSLVSRIIILASGQILDDIGMN